MDYLSILGYSGSAVLSAFVAKVGDSSLKQVNIEKRQMAENLIFATDLHGFKSSKPAIFQHKVPNECGEVKIYKQQIETSVRFVPVTNTAVNMTGNSVCISQGVVKLLDTKIGFELLSKFVTDKTFGSQKLVRSSNFIDDFNCDSTTKSSIMMGNELQDKIREDHGVQKELKPNLVHRYEYRSLYGQNLYFSGQKFGDNFVYDRMSACPQSLVDKKYENRETCAFVMKYGGMISCIGFGIAAIAEILPKSRL